MDNRGVTSPCLPVAGSSIDRARRWGRSEVGRSRCPRRRPCPHPPGGPARELVRAAVAPTPFGSCRPQGGLRPVATAARGQAGGGPKLRRAGTGPSWIHGGRRTRCSRRRRPTASGRPPATELSTTTPRGRMAPESRMGAIGHRRRPGGPTTSTWSTTPRHESTVDPATKRRELRGAAPAFPGDHPVAAGDHGRWAAGGPRPGLPTPGPRSAAPPYAGRASRAGDEALAATTDRSRRRRRSARSSAKLNRQRVEGELTDVEFNLRKHDLFVRTSTRPRPSI